MRYGRSGNGRCLPCVSRRPGTGNAISAPQVGFAYRRSNSPPVLAGDMVRALTFGVTAIYNGTDPLPPRTMGGGGVRYRMHDVDNAIISLSKLWGYS